MLAQEVFKPEPGDIFVCSYPKSGTTLMKALTFAIINRCKYNFDDSSHPLLFRNPHECVPFLRGDFDKIRDSGVPLMASHTPYYSLPKSERRANDRAFSLEQGFELFCQGKSTFGPIWDHIMGYWKASLEKPNKVMFVKYEDMKKDTASYVKKLAEFVGYPFSPQEEQAGTVRKIIDLCSFENLSGLAVNKTGSWGDVGNPVSINGDPIPNRILFRKGKVGDWSDYLIPEMAKRLDKTMEEKLSGSGLTFDNS
ncbi:hypothetical protein COLO4_13548 [Corchorus olitorius]|uniref:Sulfotransferase n=1 Tax=Corchorus olitorius TaxID=93759 RepID=A0A1R3JW00_9ROSI|nr:hypothetical protein COLO4_13548 [Corchorus olitorius]